MSSLVSRPKNSSSMLNVPGLLLEEGFPSLPCRVPLLHAKNICLLGEELRGLFQGSCVNILILTCPQQKPSQEWRFYTFAIFCHHACIHFGNSVVCLIIQS